MAASGIAPIRQHFGHGLRKLQGHPHQIVPRELETLAGRANRLREWARVAVELAEKSAEPELPFCIGDCGSTCGCQVGLGHQFGRTDSALRPMDEGKTVRVAARMGRERKFDSHTGRKLNSFPKPEPRPQKMSVCR